MRLSLVLSSCNQLAQCDHTQLHSATTTGTTRLLGAPRREIFCKSTPPSVVLTTPAGDPSNELYGEKLLRAALLRTPEWQAVEVSSLGASSKLIAVVRSSDGSPGPTWDSFAHT